MKRVGLGLAAAVLATGLVACGGEPEINEPGGENGAGVGEEGEEGEGGEEGGEEGGDD